MSSADPLDRAIAMCGTWAGTDKVLMTVGYTSKIVAWFLSQKNSGKPSEAATRFSTLSATMSEGRMLYRMWCVLPTIQMTRRLLVSNKSAKYKAIEGVQCLMMLIFHPLEFTYYFSSKKILPVPLSKTVAAAKWSVRVWVVYLALSLFKHFDEYRAIKRESKMAAIEEKQDDQVSGEKLVELKVRKQNLFDNFVRDAAYAPLAANWALPTPILPNDGWVGFFGMITALSQINVAWRKTQ